jgi:transposase InsO family protein
MNLDLMVKSDKQFLETPFYGVQQMTWYLQNEGHAVNYKRIRRLMRLMRLMPICQKPDTRRPAKGHKIYPYLLGGLRVKRPNQVWCADNVFIERLWRSLKYECVYLHAWETGSQARVGIGRWITFLQPPMPSHCPWRSTARRGLLQRNRNRSAGAGSSLTQPGNCPRVGE